MSFLMPLLSGLGGVGSMISGFVSHAAPAIGNMVAGVIESIRRAFMQFLITVRQMLLRAMTELRKFATQAMKYVPIGGLLGVSLWLTLCNSGVIPCEKPQSPVMLPMASEAVFTPPTPEPPPPPLEFTRPKYHRETAVASVQGITTMSTPFPTMPGFSITYMCPWLTRRARPRPMSIVSYTSDEVVILGRKTTQMS